jgi:OOP family OmpA-OmpF porin
VATLKRYPDLRIEVAGHTDSRGAEAYNQDLSERRANAVATYLRDAGVTNSVSARGYGESQPVASNDTDEGRQQNRRVVLRVLD